MVFLVELVEPSSTYDVFLSFRGTDTRLSFTNYLYHALVSANLATFLDDEEIPTGEFLKPELETAIKASRASVIVLSENYASSTWCLEELVLILEQKRISNQIVIPVFYHVEPTHVRKQQSSFGEAMEEMHDVKIKETRNEEERRRLAEKMEKWKDALTQVSNLKGFDASGRMEKELIEDIVNDIYSRLDGPLGTTTLPQLIGMADDIERITLWLKDGSQHTADILTIWGMGGIGKTSLANYVYELHRHKYTRCSFVGDINRRCAVNQGMLDVQKQLCGDICKRNFTQVHTIFGYTSMICKALAREKVLVVLDDIDSLDQLDELLGDKGFHPGSKIIITTKDASLTERCALFNPQVQPKHTKVSLNVLCKTDSLELLCIHAFNSQKPKEGYEVVSEKLVKYCGGYPLAVKVLGSSLRTKDVAYWEEFIQVLNIESDFRIKKVLEMSFHSLPSKNDMELFKHIACFFVGKDRDLTETILYACGIKTRLGITTLVERCLLSIGGNNKLTMHSLIQEMGRDLVCKESPKLWKRSRLWLHEESFRVLKDKKGKGNLLGLSLDMRMLDKKELGGSFELETESLSKMDDLMLLQLNYVQLNGSLENFPGEIRWLCMHGSPLKFVPLDLPVKKLVVLDMSYSNIESFGMFYSNQQQRESRQKPIGSFSEEERLLESLKILDLSFCEKLHSVGGFFELPALESLTLRNCTGLIEICESIEQCVELVYIDMSYCHNLKRIPRSLGKMKKVKTLVLDGCDFTESEIEVMEMDLPEMLNYENMVARSISRSLTISIPWSLTMLSLKDAGLANKSFPEAFSSLSVLKELFLDGNPIVAMPDCVRSLPRLETLSMYNCKRLTSVEHPPRTLRVLSHNSYTNSSQYYQSSLQKLVFDPEMSQLQLLVDLGFSADSSIQIEGIVKIQHMADVEEHVLRSLEWSDTEFIKQSCIGSQTQMYYELGIFSTFYEGKGIPHWIKHRRIGTSISFTIPSSANKLRGLNFCYVQKLKLMNGTFRLPDNPLFRLPLIKVSNITKNRTWIYKHCIESVCVVGERLIFLSHWLFGSNEMEAGDKVTITVTEERGQITSQCGIGLVYDDGRMEEEEDVLGYYKSWNHIIGGDLSAFQVTTGEYVLYFKRFVLGMNGIASHVYVSFLTGNPTYKEAYVKFRAFS